MPISNTVIDGLDALGGDADAKARLRDRFSDQIEPLEAKIAELQSEYNRIRTEGERILDQIIIDQGDIDAAKKSCKHNMMFWRAKVDDFSHSFDPYVEFTQDFAQFAGTGDPEAGDRLQRDIRAGFNKLNSNFDGARQSYQTFSHVSLEFARRCEW
jgi:hypothetical protein